MTYLKFAYYYFLKYFIFFFDKERGRGRKYEPGAEAEADSLQSREHDSGLDDRTLGS